MISWTFKLGRLTMCVALADVQELLDAKPPRPSRRGGRTPEPKTGGTSNKRSHDEKSCRA